jgi:hypothetical protein
MQPTDVSLEIAGMVFGIFVKRNANYRGMALSSTHRSNKNITTIQDTAVLM